MSDIKKLYKDAISNIMKDSMTEQEIDDYAQELADKASTVKKGDNIVHLTYYKGLISNDDLSLFQQQLSEFNIELSSYDNTGVQQNSLQDFLNHFVLVISPALLDNIVFGIAGNASWDMIKTIAKFVWAKTKGHKLNQISGDVIKEKDITFGVIASLDNETKYDFRLDGSLNDETFLLAMDKILLFLKEQKIEKKQSSQHFSRYNMETNQWEVIDIVEEIKKIHANQNGH